MRRIALCAALLCFASPTPSFGRVFAANSFWYQPIPADVELHPNSANFVKEFLRQKAAYYGTVTINTTAYTPPVYVASPLAPMVTVSQWDCQHKGYLDRGLAAQWKAVPVPIYAVPADGTDGEMAIYQPSTNSMWEFWKARQVNGAWQACWGGGMKWVSTNAGIWPSFYGTTATGLPFLGGLINPDELRRGSIDHVIGISLVDVERREIVSWPATRSDGSNPMNAPNRIPEGMRFRLDPSVNVDALRMSAAGKIIARAAQKYGFVVWDKSGAIALRAQNAKSFTSTGQPNPYPALFGGQPAYAVLAGFPWDRLQFLPMNYGKPAY